MSVKQKDNSLILGKVDPSSFSNPDQVRVTELSLFLDVDFDCHLLKGKVHLKCERAEDADETCLLLDTRDLKIINITNLKTDEKLEFTVGEPFGTFGSYLEVKLPNKTQPEGFIYNICIEYETSENASALQWLEPDQTLGKQEPFMFSQCQAIHCRSIIPCQDTPGVKCPYTAEITAPKQLTVLMSAVKDGEPIKVNGEKNLWKFTQNIPIPSYLIAIVAGRLKGKLLGLKSSVYAEPEIIQKCVYEFSETDKMLKAAIQVCGEYVWGRYDLLVLPPSFPFGGMENPCLTFVTPTLLAGDKSLAFGIAHSLFHSWYGNLVTYSSFEHAWLTEAIASFLERKMVCSRFLEGYQAVESIGGLVLLADCVKTLGENNPLTCLVPNLKGIDPDDAFSSVPYEKGHTFLFYLEEQLGGEDVFEQFLKKYLDKFKYQSINTDDFKSYLYEHFKSKKNILDSVDWETWLHTPGMPPIIPSYNRKLVQDSEGLIDQWIAWNPIDSCLFDSSPFGLQDIETLTSGQKCVFFGKLLELEPLSIPKVRLMHQVYRLEEVQNSEIRFRWLRVCIRAKWKDQIQAALKFVNEQGRMKFVRPIYRDLYNWEEARPIAIDNFHKNKKYMMFVSANQIEKDLHLNELNEETA